MLDMTDRYFSSTYMKPRPQDWKIDRSGVGHIEFIVVHHSAGWYGNALTDSSSEGAQIEMIDALAADHADRFGIGPGYHYIIASTQAFAVGKWGTHRAHTAGTHEISQVKYNHNSIGICVLGNADREPITLKQRQLLRHTVDEIIRISGELYLPVIGHNEANVIKSERFPNGRQTTTCPGKYLLPLIWDMDGTV